MSTNTGYGFQRIQVDEKRKLYPVNYLKNKNKLTILDLRKL